MSKEVRLKKKDFDLFKKEVLKWQNLLGLQSWRIDCKFGDVEDGNYAEYRTHKSGRCVELRLAEYLEATDYNPRTIKIIAFHEMFELLLQDLRNMALADAPYVKVDEATHVIVRTMENVLFGKY